MIALIAGTGALPGLLAEALVAAGDPPVICEMVGFAPDIRPDLPRLQFRLETLGTLLKTLKLAGVTRICMAGAMRRPVIDPGLIDPPTAALIGPLSAALAKGDDGTLRGIIAILERQGFEIVGADAITPGLLPKAGIMTLARPTPSDDNDAITGLAEIASMGQTDTGQACVIRGGRVVVREDDTGTDAMLTGLIAEHALTPWSRRAGVLVKAPKPTQDRRVDLPVIGPSTALRAANAGLAGIVIQAGGVMVIDQPQVVATLDGQGMFLWVRP